jgi:hypothetical protein
MQGDEVRFGRRVDEHKVVNGTTGRVLKISPLPNDDAILDVEIGHRVIRMQASALAAPGEWPRISHAYATTIYSSQGLTVDKAILMGSVALDRHHAYVGLSRSRFETQVILNRDDIRTAAREHRPLMSRIGWTPNDQELIKELARRWSMSNHKVAASDYIDSPMLAQKRLALECTMAELSSNERQLDFYGSASRTWTIVQDFLNQIKQRVIFRTKPIRSHEIIEATEQATLRTFPTYPTPKAHHFYTDLDFEK